MVEAISGLYYEEAGKGPAVLLLHGNGEDHRVFDKLARELSRKYRVIAPDLSGHGLSPAVVPYNYIELSRNVATFIESLPLEPVWLIGSSDGGIIGLYLAIRRPELLAGLVACGANCEPAGIEQEYLDELKARLEREPDPVAAMCVEQPYISKRELASILVPAWIVAGENDLIRRDHTEYIANTIPGAQLMVIPGEDHGSYINHNAKLAPFISSLIDGNGFVEA